LSAHDSLNTKSSTPRYSRVVGTGKCLPGKAISNDELSIRLAKNGVETSSDWIVARTGIEQRYFADAEVTTSQLATDAARKALASAGITASDVDLIIVATSTPDMIFPSTACLVQRQLGCLGGAAFDVQAVCAGFAYAMSVADALIKAGTAQCAVVIGAEIFSRILDFNDRGTCVLFGDGAGAVVLKADSQPGILSTAIHADGSYSNILCTAGTITNGQVTGHPFLTMDGQAVFKLAVNVLESVALEVCQKAGVDVRSVDWLIPHQANVRIINATGKKLGVAPEKVVITVNHHANTSAASIPMAIDAAVQDGRIQTGQHVLVEGVGGGFTWGAALIKF
jgi:3-oxoacyl-[acyl-carrier-protein] synthase III